MRQTSPVKPLPVSATAPPPTGAEGRCFRAENSYRHPFFGKQRGIFAARGLTRESGKNLSPAPRRPRKPSGCDSRGNRVFAALFPPRRTPQSRPPSANSFSPGHEFPMTALGKPPETLGTRRAATRSRKCRKAVTLAPTGKSKKAPAREPSNELRVRRGSGLQGLYAAV